MAVPLDLALQSIKQIALKFADTSTPKARHVNVVALRPPLIKVFLPMQVHKIELVHQPMALQQAQCAVHSHAVDLRINRSGMAKNLRGIEMTLCGFDNAEDGPTLARHADPARSEFRLQPSRYFGPRKWHSL